MREKPHEDFTITVDGITVAVRHTPRYFGEHDHFAFTDPSGERKPIPVSGTGYLSQFAHFSFVEAAGGPERYAKAFCLAKLNREPAPADDEPRLAGFQPSLFD